MSILSSIPDKYRELLQAAAQDLKAILWSEREEDAKLVQKGLLLYRQGLVYKVRLENDNVMASVQDVTPVQVELNLHFIQTSECSCPAEGICRHQLAVFFHAYAQVGSVMEWIEEWRQPIQERKVAKDLGIQRAKDLLKVTGSTKPDYDRWVEAFRSSFTSIMNGQKGTKPYLVSELFHVYERKIRASAPVEQEWKQLYNLIATVHSFQSLMQFSEERRFSIDDINRYYSNLLYQLIDDVDDLVEKLNVHALPFAFDNFMEKLKNDAYLLVSEEPIFEFEATHLYIILWTKLFRKKQWHEEELPKIHEAYQKKATLPTIIAYIHQHIMLREDEEALRILSLLNEDATPFMVYWLERLTSGKEWKRMGAYVDAFAQLIRPYIQTLNDHYARMDFTRVVSKTIGTYASETKKYDMYEKILIQALPYSYRGYDEFLFDQGSYEKWCDLQGYIGFDINSIPTEKIRLLQKERPDVLLPLYHQSIQQHIDMKNRGNYREAVKQLKKLRTLYKKLKRPDDFQEFLKILLDKTRRLRAFHQECERGKLTHA